MEKLRLAKSRRLALASKFAGSKATTSEQRRIKVIEFERFRRRVLVKFEFADGDKSETGAPSEHNFLVLADEFKTLLQQHQFYEIVFDLPRKEFLKHHFIHFGQLIRAGRAS